MEDIEVTTPSAEASEPAEREMPDSKTETEAPEADAPENDPGPPEEDAAPEEIVVEQLLIVEDTSAPDQERARIRAVIEAVVYVTDEPLTLQQIASALNHPIDKVQAILDELIADYNRPERGLSIREIAGGYKMATRPEHHEAVRAFVRNLKPPLKLSLPALETLAVVAYKQPVTVPEIVVGKPILYKTTREFMIQFGLNDLAELPTLKEFEELSKLALSDSEPEVEPLVEPDSEPASEPNAEPEVVEIEIAETPTETAVSEAPASEEG